MVRRTKKFLKLFYDAGYNMVWDDGIEHAGYLAFLALLSIFPSIIFLFAIVSHIGRKDYGADLIKGLYGILPSNVSSQLAPTINEILTGPTTGLLTIAIIGVIWTASGMVEALRTILNRVYRVKNPPHYLLRRALSIFQFIWLTFVLVIGMFFLTIVPSVIGFVGKKVNIGFLENISGLRLLGSSFALFIGVALSYYILPNIRQSFFRIIWGAKLCVVLWLLVIGIFTNYVAYYHRINSVYGSLAGVVITLVFFYVLSVIYIYCAEFNYLLEKFLGHEIRQKEEVVINEDGKEVAVQIEK